MFSRLKQQHNEHVQYYWQELSLNHDPFAVDSPGCFRVKQWDNYHEIINNDLIYSEVMPVIIGDVGVGKSTLLQDFLYKQDHTIKMHILEANSEWTSASFINALNVSIGFAQNEQVRESLSTINQSLSTTIDKYLVAIDNAEQLSEEIILLLKDWCRKNDSRTKLKFMLVANTSFVHRLKLNYSVQEYKTLLHVLEMQPLDFEQTKAYLHYCMLRAGYVGGMYFSSRQLREINSFAQGFFSNINEYARKVLIDDLFKHNRIQLIIKENSMLFLLLSVVLSIAAVLLLLPEQTNFYENEVKLILPNNDAFPENGLAVSEVLDDFEQQQGVPSLLTDNSLTTPVATESSQLVNEKTVTALTHLIIDSSAQDNTSVSNKNVTIKNLEDDTIIQERANIILLESAGDFTIQLIAVPTVNEAVGFIKQFKLEKLANYYVNNLQSSPWYSVIYGSYHTKDEARMAITKMPFKLRKNNPWIRKFSEVQSIIVASNEK